MSLFRPRPSISPRPSRLLRLPAPSPVAMVALALASSLASAPRPAAAQEPEAPSGSGLTVFLECEGRGCDLAEYRERIPWVTWVEDPTRAKITVDLSREASAGEGFQYTLAFATADGVPGGTDELFYRSGPAQAETDEVEGIATTLSIGFARYATLQGLREFVTLRSEAAGGVDPGARIVSAQEVDDPWNLWTFTVGGNGNLNGSETRRTTRLSGNVSANRTTPVWKISLSMRGSLDKRRIERSDGSIVRVDDKDATVNLGITYALADHWSLDLSSLSAKLPSFNQAFRGDLTPGIEYSLFPYAEATRRSITLRYTVPLTYRRYDETSIFGKDEEVNVEHGLRLAASMRQPWGDASASVVGSHFLDDVDKHNVTLRGSLSFRVVRGLRFNVGGDIAWVTDQVYLSAGGVTDEEALLRLRTRRSTNNKGLNFGFSYEFGSIYNNTVNNRFPSVGRGGRG